MSEFAAAAPDGAGRGFFRQRWHGRVALRRLFWWDLLAVGTLLNAACAVFALILLAQGLAGGAWFALQALILPYNLFLVTTVWRHPEASTALRSFALTWLGASLLV